MAPSGAEGLSTHARRAGAASTSSSPTSRWRASAASTWSRPVRERDPDCPVMIVTAFGTVETAVEAMKLGAFDFLHKPFAPEVVRLKVERALELRRERRARERAEAENAALRADAAAHYRFAEIVGETPADARACSRPSRRSPRPTRRSTSTASRAPARSWWRARSTPARSAAHGPFVKVNCGALTETLLESELFGHEKGAFTGAIKRKLGRFELADKGTLFLDEIGDVTPGAAGQAAARAAGAGSSSGSAARRRSRSTCACCRPPTGTSRPRSRRGGSARICSTGCTSCPCTVPPLRERHEDIPRLVAHFIAKLGPAHQPGGQAASTDAALARLCAYRWPGNVRELENVIEQALVFAEGDAHRRRARCPRSCGAACPTTRWRCPAARCRCPRSSRISSASSSSRRTTRAAASRPRRARLLGIKTSALYYKLEKYGIGVIESRGDKGGGPEAAPQDERLLEDGPPGKGGGGRERAR